jgi:hypothetical protein
MNSTLKNTPETNQWEEAETLLESLAPGFEEFDPPDLATREQELLEDLARAEKTMAVKVGQPHG